MTIRSTLFAVFFLSGASIFGQSAADPNEGSQLQWNDTSGSFRFSWWGRVGRTYFLQYSEDLLNWSYLPVVESGEGSPTEWDFNLTGERVYLRLRHSDRPTSDPAGDDFDSDGMENLEEVLNGGDPLVRAAGRAVWKVYGPQGSGGYGEFYTYELSGLFPSSYVRMSSGWITLTAEFVVDQTAPPSPIWYGQKLFPTAVPYNFQVLEVYTTDPDDFAEGDRAYMGTGWVSDAFTFVPNFGRPSSPIWYGPKSFTSLNNVQNVYTHDASDLLPTSQLSVGKGWITASNTFRADFHEPPAPVWVGYKTTAFILNPSAHTYDPDALNSGTAQLLGNGWIHGQAFIADDGTIQSDPDGDGLITGVEIHWHGTDPNNADTDKDGLNDGEETQFGTNPKHFDSDHDLLPDQWEVAYGLDPLSGDQNGNGVLDSADDFDGDGLSNLDETSFSANPWNPDTDGDGASDGDEAEYGGFPNDPGDGGGAPPPWNPPSGGGASPPVDLPKPGDSIRFNLKVGDASGSHSERYALVVTDTTTGNSFQHQAPEFGEVAEKVYGQFRYGHAYKFQVRHAGTNPEFLKTNSVPDFDGEASVDLVDSPYTLSQLGYIVIDPYDPATQQVPVGEPKVLASWSDQEDFPSTTAQREARLLPVDIAVDANRDGVIKFAGNYDSTETQGKLYDKNEQAKPFRFWLNNDDDRLGEDHPGSATKDSDSALIETARDLEDFTRLHIYLGGLQDAVAAGTIQIGVKWKNTEGSPALNLWTADESDGGTKYLTDEATAEQQGQSGASPLRVTGTQAFPLEAPLLGSFSATNPVIHLLFEAAGEGKGELSIVLLKDGQEIGEGPGVWLDLKDIKKMYQRADVSGKNQWPAVQFEPDPNEEKQVAVFVHGWRMSPEGASTFAETMYKRLWHRGFKGRFAAVRWDTYWENGYSWVPYAGEGINSYLSKYNDSEHNAWLAGPAVASFVNSLPPGYDRSIAAHSMGNIVTGSALLAGMNIENYALLQAAVPAACYDESGYIAEISPYEHTVNESFPGNQIGFTMWDDATPDDDVDPATRGRAYRGRLKNVNGILTSFYLEEDFATSIAWEINNDQTKPPRETGAFVTSFQYVRNDPAGEKLYRFHWETINGNRVEVVHYFLEDEFEAMPYACRTWGKAAGAEHETRGSIKASVNLGDTEFQLKSESRPGFGDEHSGEFKASIQELTQFYNRLLEAFQLEALP